ncbi:MAG: hypothetical protein ACRCXZ_09715 [Patescibacteria group bacterium]
MDLITSSNFDSIEKLNYSFIGKTGPFTKAHRDLILSGLLEHFENPLLSTKQLGSYKHIIGSSQASSFKTNTTKGSLVIPLVVRYAMVESNLYAISNDLANYCFDDHFEQLTYSVDHLPDNASNAEWVKAIQQRLPQDTILITSNIDGVKKYFDEFCPNYFGFLYCDEDFFGAEDHDILAKLGVKSVHATEIRTWLQEGKLDLAYRYLTQETIDLIQYFQLN